MEAGGRDSAGRIAGATRGARAVLLAAWLGATAAVAAEPSTRLPLRFRSLRTDHGLSDSTVEAVLQDHRGFMWIGTADGLNRYDGYEFKVYLPDEDDPASVAGGYVWDLFEDRKGVLWVGTSHGLSRYVRDTDSFVSYRGGDGPANLSFDWVQDILEDGNGELWVATGRGLNRMDRVNGTFERYLHDPADVGSLGNDNVRVLHEDGEGRLWVGTAGGLDLFDRQAGTFSHFRHDDEDRRSLSHDSVRDVLEDRQGRLWVGTDKGLDRLDPGRMGAFIRHAGDPHTPGSLLDGHVWVLFEDSDGVLWVGTDRAGLAYRDPATGGFVHYTHDPLDPRSISSNVVYDVYEDSSGDLWTGNYAGGINHIDRAGSAFRQFTNIPGDPESLNHSSVLSFLEDRSGVVWVGTEDGLARFDQRRGRFVRYQHDPDDPDSLGAPPVPALLEDREGAIWAGTYGGGLSRFDPRLETFSPVPLQPDGEQSALSSQVWCIEEDDLGLLWAGTTAGLYRLDPATGETRVYRAAESDPTSLAHDIVWDLHEDSEGRLWVGTHEGLGRYDRRSDAFVNFTHREGDATSLSFGQVNVIHEDGERRLWVGTHGGGLNLLDPGRRSFTSWREADGLPSDVVLSVVDDAAGNLWLGTNRGLSRYDPRTGVFTNLDHNDGLQSRQFNRGAALRRGDGELLFGGIGGFNIFEPERVHINTVPPRVVITGFQIFNRDVEVGDGALTKQISEAESILLRHDQSVLSFEFAALNFRNPGKNEYQYILEGFDADWVQAGSQRSVTYTNLDPGEYTFRVRGSNNSGVWNLRGTSVQLTVLPPLWATWWFRLVSLAAVCALVFGVYRLRVRTFRRHNQELEAEIAERLRAEREREALLAETEAKSLALERQNAELERFAYTVSHDLKSPLVTIRGFLGLLRKDVEAGDPEAVERAIDQIGVASETMSRLLGDVLELSRIGRIANPSENVHLSELAEEAAGLIAGQIQEKGVELEIATDMPTVYGDRVRLLEVFQNLLGNAVRFLDDQPQPRVSVGGGVEDGRIVCFVRDNGRGIEKRYHDKIFGLFERLDPAGEGSGIGLALVKRIVEVHGGRIWVESDGPGHGSTFWFSLADEPGGAGTAP